MKFKLKFPRKKKKGADDDATEAPSGQSSPTEKSGKGAKQWLFLHVEKLVVAGVVVLSGVLVFAASGKLNLKESQSPRDLQEKVEQINNRIEGSAWPETAYPIPDFGVRIDTARRTVDPDAFAFRSIVGETAVDTSKRTDPQYMPAQDVEVAAGNGIFWVRSKSGIKGNVTVQIDAEQRVPVPNVTRGLPRPEGAIEEGRRWVAVNARVPLARQQENYLGHLANGLGFDPKRDVPRYAGLRLRRVEIGPENAGVEIDWEKAQTWSFKSWYGEERQQRSTWATVAPELVEPQYIDSALAKPLGPLALKSWKPWASQSQIPLAKPKPPAMHPRMRPGMHPGMPPGMHPGMHPEMHPEMKPDLRRFQKGAGHRPPRSPVVVNVAVAQAAPEDGDLEGWFGDEPEDPKPDPEEPPPEEKPAEEPVESVEPEPVDVSAEFQLVRVFDFSVEPGKSYRYSVQIALWNPHVPQLWPEDFRSDAIPARFLEAPETMREGKIRETPWSEASAIVLVPNDAQVFAAEIKPPAEKETKEKAVIVAQILEVASGRVPTGIFELQRGQVVDGQTKVFREDVTAGELVIGTGEIKTGMVLLDMRGGEKILGDTSRPSEFLFLDPQGNLFLKNSAVDQSIVGPIQQQRVSASAATEKAEREAKGAGRRDSDERDPDIRKLLEESDGENRRNRRKAK